MLWLKPGVLASFFLGGGGIFTYFMMQSSQLFQSYRLPPFSPPPPHIVFSASKYFCPSRLKAGEHVTVCSGVHISFSVESVNA